MMWRQHGTSATLVWLAGVDAIQACGGNVGPLAAVGGAVVCFGAGLIPDIDHHDSKAAHSLGVVTEVVAGGISGLFGHRRLTHWLLTGALFGLLIGSIVAALVPWLWWIGLAVAVGCAVHTLGDALTVQGSPLLGPFSFRRYGPPRRVRFATGHLFELLVASPVFTAGATWALLTYVRLAGWPLPAIVELAILATTTTPAVLRGVTYANRVAWVARRQGVPVPGQRRADAGVPR